MKAKRILSAALAISMLALSGCGGQSDPSPSQTGSTGGGESLGDNTIKVGALFPLSGASSYYGGVQLDGIEFCVDYINNTLGGISSMDGAKIELVVQDTASDPETESIAFIFTAM